MTSSERRRGAILAEDPELRAHVLAETRYGLENLREMAEERRLAAHQRNLAAAAAS